MFTRQFEAFKAKNQNPEDAKIDFLIAVKQVTNVRRTL
ncbi:hypothetical protein FLACHUCJ7_00983 [Flavobacterium chungangense]|uniref:Uncharacterized protein n=1 Tax=Flavobacterium chungangense TaxID=554283 RepID=A0A6V6YSP7_9FLAO|nr:hypothetical protein FLACHUCJ7_00983 [Flavobacterium chungangense]